MNSIKKILLVVVIALVGVGAANAQFRFGIKAGLNVDKLHLNESTFNKDNGVGWTAGLMTEFQVPVIGLCFDLSLMYTHMNNDLMIDPQTDGGTSIPESVNNKNFLEIPINLKYKFKIPVVASIFSPYIFTGPSFAFKLDKNTLDYFKTKTCQMVWNVGLGFELVKHLQIGASYGFGMNNIAEKYNLNPDLKIKNNYWTITAAYLF